MNNYLTLANYIRQHQATLVVVSKTQSVEKIQELYDQGQRIFGENKVQEICEKQALLPEDVSWHMIGHLQKNKVKYIAPFISLVHSVDNTALAIKIDKEALKNERTIDILLQIKVAEEAEKTGYGINELMKDLVKIKSLENIRILGVMGMSTFTSDERVVSREFELLKNYFDIIKSEYFSNSEAFSVLSMGMSGDYQLAINHGSTMVRIGSLIFGERT